MLTAFFYGARRATRSFKLLLSLFVTNLFFALPLIIPVFAMIQLSTANRLSARQLLADQLDPVWLIDILNSQLPNSAFISFATETFIALYVVAGLYLLFNVLLSGGVLGYYLNPEKRTDERFSLRLFWAYCGAYVWRFLRLLMYAAVFYGLLTAAYLLARRGLNARLTLATELGNTPWYRLALFVCFVLGLAWLNMVFDYARIHTIAQEERSMWRALLAGLRFSARHLFTAYPLYLLIAGLGFSLFLGLTWLRDTVIQDGMFAVGLATALGHVALLAKLWAKLALAAGQVHFYEARQPARVEVTEPVESAFEFRAATSAALDPVVLARAEAAYAEAVVKVSATNKLPTPGETA